MKLLCMLQHNGNPGINKKKKTNKKDSKILYEDKNTRVRKLRDEALPPDP